MGDRSSTRPCFVEEMRAQLLTYEIDKITRRQRELQANGELFRRERQAKDALIELDNDETSMLTDEDYYIGRWSLYRVPEKIEQRLSLNRRSGKTIEDSARPFRLSERERVGLGHNNCHSERTIPKLKVMLHQLEHPLDLPANSAKRAAELGRKMKNHIGKQALVISNKQEIRSHSERKMTAMETAAKGSENKRPQSKHDSIKGETCTGTTYQKIKRPFGFHNQHQQNDLVYEREILSHLIKGKAPKPTPEPSPLTNMIDYFTMSEKRKKPQRIGLDKLLS